MRPIKTLAFALLSALIFPNLASAQDTYFGPKGGFNFNTFYGNDDSDAGLRLGYHLGGFADIGLSDAFSLRPELLFSLEGARTVDDPIVGRTSLYYLTVPVMARYSMNALYFEAGPNIGFLLGGKSFSRNTESGDSDSQDLDMEEYKTAEFALNFGGGYRLDNGLEFGLRFDLGLTGTRDFSDLPDRVQEEAEEDNPKNLGIQLTAGYGF